MELRTNAKIELAREFILYTHSNIFLTGKAGTGKTTFLRNLIKETTKRTVVAAPTGVAALNAGGVTLHSLFQLPFGVHLPGVRYSNKGRYNQKISRQKLSLIRSIELLVIDEVSMVRSDMLDAIDQTLRSVRRTNIPFGGVQLLMIGDIQQLAPICKDEEWDMLREHYTTPFFYGSHALAQTSYITIEFDEIFRQKDIKFMELLNAVRENRITQQQLERLNSRYIPNFTPSKGDDYITLTTHNRTAEAINRSELAQIKSSSKFYKAITTGTFPANAYPNDEVLELKVGAQVLFIKNDTSATRQYYNGMLGDITELGETFVVVKPKNREDILTINIMEWENLEYKVNAKSGEMEQEVKGTFKQLPLKCAWAITIHKSQGLSFDRAIIDASGSFAHGQVYVALSRCRSMEGIVLRSELSNWAIIGDKEIEEYCRHISENQPTQEMLHEHKRSSYSRTLAEIFDFEAIRAELWDIMNIMSGALNRAYPKVSSELIEMVMNFDKEIAGVGKIFQGQLQRLVTQSECYDNDPIISERLKKAAAYYQPKIEQIAAIIKSLSSMHSDSTTTQQRLTEHLQSLNTMVKVVLDAIKRCGVEFNMSEFMSAKSCIIAQSTISPEKSDTTKREKKTKPPKDIQHQELYQLLSDWRLAESREINKPPFTIFSNKSLVEIQTSLPRNEEELLRVNGVGANKLYNYGDQILDIVNKYCRDNNL